MGNFKFLRGEERPFEETSSWIFGREEHLYQYPYDIITEYHYGIHSFLNQFPTHFIVCILSITGPNEIVHNADNEGIGWGFDITCDLIKIEWIRFREI